MSKKWITILVAAVIGALLMPTAALAACKATVVNNLSIDASTNGGVSYAFTTDPVPYPAGSLVDGIKVNTGAALTLNSEGVVERVADILITDDGALPFCFTGGSDIVVTYNATLTSPASPGTLGVPANLDIFDSKGIAGLTVTSATISQVFAANTTNSQIDIKVGQTGTAGATYTTCAASPCAQAGAALRVKNIRVNASAAGNAFAVSATLNGTASNVGNTLATVSAVTQPGTPVAGGLAGGVQSSNAGLAAPQTIAFTEGFAGSMRWPGTAACNSSTAANDKCYSQVANDIATTATSLAFSVTGIPSGVTVTFPSTMSTSAATVSANSLSFKARSATLSNSGAPGTLPVIYDNSNKLGENTGTNSMTIGTADTADGGTKAGASSSNPNCTSTGGDVNSGGTVVAGATCNTNPKIGVKVGTISLAGTANLWWSFGPDDVGGTAFTGDDVAASTAVIPRYTGDVLGCTPTAGNCRLMVQNKPFFTIFPTRTTLLFPFVSTRGGWNTGLSIANTGLDTGVFTTATAGQLGGMTLFFFGVNPLTGAVVTDSVNSDLTSSTGKDISSACRGLDASGRVAAGQQTACVLSTLLGLLPTKPSAFDGYVIAVTGFNFAHGFSVVLDASGAPFAADNALILGGNGVVTTRPGGEVLGH